MSPGLERVALRPRCPVGPSGTVTLGHQSQLLQRYHWCGLYAPSFYGWVLIATDTLVGGQGWPPGWLVAWVGQDCYGARWCVELVSGTAGCGAWSWLLWDCWCAELSECFGGTPVPAKLLGGVGGKDHFAGALVTAEVAQQVGQELIWRDWSQLGRVLGEHRPGWGTQC